MMKSLICLSLIILPLIAIVEGSRPRPGSPSEIDVSDQLIIDIATFAIDEFNKRPEANLVFVKVVRGTVRVVVGREYKLIIAAKNGGGATENYKADVFWAHSLVGKNMFLLSFKAVS